MHRVLSGLGWLALVEFVIVEGYLRHFRWISGDKFRPSGSMFGPKMRALRGNFWPTAGFQVCFWEVCVFLIVVVLVAACNPSLLAELRRV